MAEAASISLSTDSKDENISAMIDNIPSVSISDEVVEDLAVGMLNSYQPDVENIHTRVKEIIRNQGVLMDSTQNEVIQLKECIMLQEITETFNQIKTYQKKLQNMKKNMSNINEKTQKAKNRALKLQIQRQKEDLHVAQEKEKQRKYEHELTAKPAQSMFSKNAES